MRALSVFLVNRRKAARRRYADVAYAFQARLEIRCEAGLVPRHDLSAWRSDDEDQRIADLHYRDEVEYAVGRNTSGGWEAPDEAGVVRRAWTDPLPMAEVERVAPNEDIRDVEFGMEALAGLADGDGAALASALEGLPAQYGLWIEGQRALLEGLPGRRRETGARLIEGAEGGQATDRRGHRAAGHGRAGAPGIPHREPCGRARAAAARGRRKRRSGGDRRAGLAAVPAGVHPAQSRRAGRPRRTPIARSWTSCSSRPAAARPRPISGSPPSPSPIGASAPAASWAPASP